MPSTGKTNIEIAQDIARVRRAMPKNDLVLGLMDELEIRLLPPSNAPDAIRDGRSESHKLYMRTYMRDWRSRPERGRPKAS